jgi:hypothetical protein
MTLRKTSFVSAILLLSAAPMAAEWLVTRDGGRVETLGKWKVEGSKVVFTLPNGTLGVLRKSEVDLDASAAASTGDSGEAKKAAEPPAKKPAAKPVLVLTDKDIAKAPAPAASSEDAAAAAAAPAADPKADQDEMQSLRVTAWNQKPGAQGGLELTGMVQNFGNDIAVNITVEVVARDAEGKSHKALGFVERTSLVRDRGTVFRAVFPDLNQMVGEPEIKVRSEGASVGMGPGTGQVGKNKP